MIKTLYFFENSDDQYTMPTLEGAKELIRQLDCWEDAVINVYKKEWRAGGYYWETVENIECATPSIYDEIEDVKSTIRNWENEIELTYKDIDEDITSFEDEEEYLQDAQDNLYEWNERLEQLESLAAEL